MRFLLSWRGMCVDGVVSYIRISGFWTFIGAFNRFGDREFMLGICYGVSYPDRFVY